MGWRTRKSLFASVVPAIPATLTVRPWNPSSGALNPGFDVTPPELITGIITPMGIFKPAELWANRHGLGHAG